MTIWNQRLMVIECFISQCGSYFPFF